MNPKHFLVVTAVLEAGAGLSLLVAPGFILRLLLGLEQAVIETLLVTRLAGAALLAFGIACWAANLDRRSPAPLSLLVGVLIYNMAAAALLGWAGAEFSTVGIALWPGVGLHAAMTCWCLFLCVGRAERGSLSGR